MVVNSEEQQSDVSATSGAYDAMAQKWKPLDDLLAGTQGMRQVGQDWLPREPREKEGTYSVRLNNSFLFEGYKNCLDNLESKPFSQSVKHNADKISDSTQSLIDDIDKQGTNLTQFAREVFREGIHRGLSHILIDYPQLEDELNLAEQKSKDIRPYFIHLKPRNVIAWRTRIDQGGTAVLTHVRIREQAIQQVGQYGEKVVNRIRVYEEQGWELFEQQEQEDGKTTWVLISSGLNTLGFVPIVTFYANKTAVMQATPPLEGLGWSNIAHWQTASGHRNGIRLTQTGLLFGAGISKDTDLAVGANRMITAKSPDAKMAYVEHHGWGLEHSKKQLDDLKDEMAVLGSEPLMQRPGNETATGRAIDESHGNSAIQQWVRNLENTLAKAFKIASQWAKDQTLAISPNIFNDFGVGLRATHDIQAIQADRARGDIDHETFINEMKRRGVYMDSVMSEDVLERLGDQGSALGKIGQ